MSIGNDFFDPLRPHSHEPNPAPPSEDATIEFVLPNGRSQLIAVTDLKTLPAVSVTDCYIASTGHGTSGPFTFSGATLLAVVNQFCEQPWSQVEVISADGFGNRVLAEELHLPDSAGPTLLAYQIDGQSLTREQGLVRMIVPSERDDALRQVKWVGKIVVVGEERP